MSVLQDPELESLLAKLHARSDAQAASVAAFHEAQRSRQNPGADDEARTKQFRSDKFVALDRDKAAFCYQLCRACDARRVVEIGTSYGVSTLYLAAAVRDNSRNAAKPGRVIGTEYEPQKALEARKHFKKAGLAGFVELREGDFRETLKSLEGPIDFVLVDIWIRMARPALELLAPLLRPGAIVVCDNTQKDRADYADYMAFLDDPKNGFRTMTLPFEGGLEMSVRCR